MLGRNEIPSQLEVSHSKAKSKRDKLKVGCVLFDPPRTALELPVTTGVGLGFWVVPSSHMLKTEYPCHFCGKGFSGATVRDIG